MFYGLQSGVRRCRWQSLLALILRLVDGPMVLVDLPAVDWSPPAGSGDERQVQPRALPKDRRLALIMQPEDTCCATWAADLLLSTVLPCLQPRERVELVEALRRPLCGSPSFARLATAAACAHCAELEGAASPGGSLLWRIQASLLPLLSRFSNGGDQVQPSCHQAARMAQHGKDLT